jgi:hypothetical protein
MVPLPSPKPTTETHASSLLDEALTEIKRNHIRLSKEGNN